MHILHINLNRRKVTGGLMMHVDALMKKQLDAGYRVTYFSSGNDDLLFIPHIKKSTVKESPARL